MKRVGFDKVIKSVGAFNFKSALASFILLFSSSSKLFSACFVLYVLLIPSFACFYQSMYENQNSSFIVSSEVVESLFDEETKARKIIIDDLKRELELLTSELEILKPAYQSLQENHQLDYFDSGYTSGKAWNETYEIIISYGSEGGWIIEVGGLTLPISAKVLEFRRLSRALFGPVFFRNIGQVVRYLENRIEELKKENSSQEPIASEYILTFSDFLYFSTVTQTTLGYGDIVPGSNRVRRLVTFQILIALLLLGLAGTQFVNIRQK